jgi:hypothetical protein
MLVNRNLSALGSYGSLNTAWVWSESDGAFIAVLTTETGSTTGQINRSYFANVKIGNINAVSANVSKLLVTNLVSSGVLTGSGNILADSGTTSPLGQYTQGAIVVPGQGGVGIGGNLNVHGIAGFDSNVDITGNLNVTGNINAIVNQIASFSGVFYGNAAGIGALYAGVTNYTQLDHTVLQLSANLNNYAQLNFQNTNNGAFASGDIVVTADNGDDNDGYIDLGINSSAFNDPNYPGYFPNDGYLVMHGIEPATGNLNIHSHGTGSVIKLIVGGFGDGNVKAAVTNTGFVVNTATTSTSTTTGALLVNGGAGIRGNLHATAINNTPIGNSVPSTGAFTTLTASGATTFTSSATSTTYSDGAVVVTGGVGVGGNLNVGSNLVVTGNTVIQGNLTVQGEFTTLNVATLDVEDLNITVAKGAANPAAANGAGLTVDGANATITYANSDDSWNFNKKVNFTGTATTVLGNVNITSGNISTLFTSNFSSGNVQITGGNITNLTNLTSTNVYATNFSSGNVLITGGYIDGTTIGANVPSTGNFTTTYIVNLNATNGNLTTLYAQNFNSANAVITGGYADNYPIGANVASSGRFTTLTVLNATNMAGNLVLSSGTTTPFGSSTQGALVLTGEGGAAVGGNVTIMGGLAVNYSATAASGHNFIVKGVNDSSLIWAKPGNSYDQVVIGGNVTTGTVVAGAKLHIDSTDSVLLPKGYNSDRPSSAGATDVAGMLRFSLTSNSLEFYDGTGWVATSISYNIISSTQFSAASGDPNGNVDGVNAVFTLPAAATTNGCIVSINGVVQLPTVAYSIGGAGNDVLTFTEAPALGDVIDVRTLVTTSQVTTLESATGFNSIKLTNSNVKITTGTSSTNDTVEWNTAGAQVNLRANVAVATSGSPAVVDSFSSTVYSSADYTITATIQNTNIRQICKVTLVTDGTATTVAQFGNVCTAGNSLVAFTGGFSAGSAQLKATTSDNNTIFRIAKLYQPL